MNAVRVLSWATPQAVEIEGEAQEKGLPPLHEERAARRARRELAFYRGEDALYHVAAAVLASREAPPHARPHAVTAPRGFAACGGDDAGRAEGADVLMIAFAIELGVGEDARDRRDRVRGVDHGPQRRAVIVRTAPGLLGDEGLRVDIDDDQPLETVRPRPRLLPAVFARAPNENRAHRAGGEPRAIERDGRARTSAALQLLCDYANGRAQRRLIDPMQEPIERRVVGHGPQPEGAPEFAMLAQSHLGLAEGPVLVAHHTKQREQLGLRELMLRELAPIAGQHRASDCHRMACERHQADLGHRSSLLSLKDDHGPRMSTEPV